MKEKQENMKNFLKANNLNPDNFDIDEDIKLFKAEMRKGLDSSSSIPMLPSYIEDDMDIPIGEKVLVLDAGGTNFRAAIVGFSKKNEAVITDFKKTSMPGTDRELSYDEFFKTIADFIKDLAVKVERIGFCFSYPTEMTPDKDGRLIKFSKEVKAPEVEGKLIGAGVIEALKKAGINNIKKIVILNDTVATLLAGKTADNAEDFSSFTGFILGTGVNMSYRERNSNIIKVKNLPQAGNQLINMETGSCGIMKSGPVDELFRTLTVNPESYKLEKMVSGAYLGPLWLTALSSAGKDGLLSSGLKESLDRAVSEGPGTKIDSSALSLFLSEGIVPDFLKDEFTEDDREIVEAVSESIIRRAAYVVAVMLSSVINKCSEEGASPKPVCICADGTTFWKMHGLKARITEYLDDYFSDKNTGYVITGIDDAPVIGAAVAGLTNR